MLPNLTCSGLTRIEGGGILKAHSCRPAFGWVCQAAPAHFDVLVAFNSLEGALCHGIGVNEERCERKNPAHPSYRRCNGPTPIRLG